MLEEMSFDIAPNDSDQNFEMLHIPLSTLLRADGASISIDGSFPANVFNGHIALGYLIKDASPDASLAFKPLFIFTLPEEPGAVMNWPVVLPGIRMPGMCVSVAPEDSILMIHLATTDQLTTTLEAKLSLSATVINVLDL